MPCDTQNSICNSDAKIRSSRKININGVFARLNRVNDAAIGVVNFKTEGSAQLNPIDQAADINGGTERSRDASGVWKDVTVGIGRVRQDEKRSPSVGDRHSREVEIEILNNDCETILTVAIGFLADEEVCREDHIGDRNISTNRGELEEGTTFNPSPCGIIENDRCRSGVDANDDLIG